MSQSNPAHPATCACTDCRYNDSTPSSRPVAGSDVQDAIRNFRRVVQAGPSDAQMVQDCGAILDALDAAKEGRSGCGKPFWADVDCGAYAVNDPEPLLCYDCKAKMWAALSALLGGDDA